MEDKKNNNVDEVFHNILKIMGGDFFINEEEEEENGTD